MELYDVHADPDTGDFSCDEIPGPSVAIEVIAPGAPVDAEPVATVLGEPSCVPQDSEGEGGGGYRILTIIAEGRSEPREVTIEVETVHGTLTTSVDLPAVASDDDTGSTTTTEDDS
jgi:hypothetical protein